MKRNYINKMLAVLVASTIISSTGIYSSKVYANPNDILEKALKSVKEKNLTEKLDTVNIVQIDPLIDTKSDKEISVIVQLKGDVIKESKEKIKGKHDKFKDFVNKKNASKSNKKIKIKEEYSNVFNGMSLKISANEVNSLLECEDVLAVWSDQEVKLEPIVKNEKMVDKKNPTNVDSVNQIEANKLHEKNITGKGVKVGVIDTGIDYNHPDLKGNYKGGYDCVDEDNDPMETTYEDWLNSGEAEFKPSSYYTDHGTHVSGSIAGSGKSGLDHSVKGVAPEADIYAYRVLGPYGAGYNSDVLQGIELAVQQGMDVINLSLGTEQNNPYTPTAQALNNAMLKGTTVVVASGNSGSDVGTVGSPGSASFPITVGASSTNITRTTYDLKVGEDNFAIKSLADDFNSGIDKLENKEYEIVYVESGDTFNYNKLGLTKEDVQGKIVLISYGSGNVESKLKLAKEYGAEGAILYSVYFGEIEGIYEGKDLVPAFTISKDDGTKIKANISAKANFTNKQTISDGSEELAYFSSQGPGYYEFDVKPDVVAPGVDVYSTVPVYITDRDTNNYEYAYERMNGTSMAAPHVTGAVVLLKQANKKLTPFDIKEALMNTAEELDSKYGVNQIGSGRINVYDAVNNKLNISSEDSTKIQVEQEFIDLKATTGSLSFGKYSGDKGTTIEKELVLNSNSNKQDEIYEAKVEFYNNYPASNAEVNGVRLDGLTNEIKVNKKNPTTIKTKIVVPEGAEKGSYQGYIILTNKNNSDETYRIPFSINYSEEGIKELWHLREGISTKYDELFTPLLEAHMELGSHMTEISVFVEDPNTKDILGISGAADISGAPVNIPVRLGAFAGYVLPIDENGNVGTEFKVLSEGDYNIVYLLKDALGKEYKKTVSTWIDNTTPELTFNQKTLPGVYEFDSIPKTFNVKAISKDAGIEHLMELKGADTYLDQSWSNVYWYEHNNFINFDLIIPETDGSFEVNLNLEKDINKFAICAIDIFGAGSLRERKDFYILKTGTPYIYSSFDKNKVKQGEEFTMSTAVKNIDSFENGTFTVSYLDNHKVQDIKLNEDFVAYASEKGYEFELVVDNIGKENSQNIYDRTSVTINTITKGEEPLAIDSEIKVFDVKLKAEGDFYYYSGMYEAYEECLIKDVKLNNETFENILNTNFIYESAKVYF